MRNLFPTQPFSNWLRAAIPAPKVLALGVAGLLGTSGHAQAQTFPAGFSAVRVVNGLTSPTAMTFAPDGRIFVCEQQGTLRVVKNGQLLALPFATIRVFGDDGTTGQGERGLIGVTVDPDFLTNNYIYVYYTLPNGANNRIVRYTANGDVALAGSEKVILDLDPLLSSATNHNGGAMHFGPGKKLFVAVGENTRRDSAQRLTSYFGKLLRLNPDGSAPADNPYASSKNAHAQRVWSSGDRNPYTFSIEPGTGRIFINNVGESSWEEINDATVPGRNFGWPSQPGGEGYSVKAGQTAPLYAYPHQTNNPDSTGCALTGGTFFSPTSTNYPAQYKGKYFYMDYCGQWINYIDPNSSNPRATRKPFALRVGGDALGIETGPDGNIYYMARNTGALLRLTYTATNSAPVITASPASVTTSVGRAATFSVGASSASTLTYQWQKNEVDIAGATSSTYSIANVAKADAGTYRAVVTNSVGATPSAAATLTVKDANTDPVASIKVSTGRPLVNGQLRYSANDVVTFSATATDKEDGALPASAFSWEILTHHNTHTHPFIAGLNGVTAGMFTTPDRGEVSDNIYFIINLTVTDKAGQAVTQTVNVFPNTVDFVLTTTPNGGVLYLDGTPQEPRATTVKGVQGIIREISAPASQLIKIKQGDKEVQVPYNFVSWSDGGARTHEISTPTTATTYTANYEPANGTTNTVPTAGILTPTAATTYVAGTTLSFSGTGTDKEDGTLPASAFAWKIQLIHAEDNEVHHTDTISSVQNGSFTIPTTETAEDVYYLVSLVVTDSKGLSSPAASVKVYPLKATISLATIPAGLGLTRDGAAQTTPASLRSVQGITHSLGAPSPQTLNGVTYTFVSWSDGGTQTHNITTPGSDVTYTATFQAAPTTPTSGQRVTSLTLINADTDLPLAGYDPLVSGTTLNLAALPTKNLSIRANTNPATVGSVRFGYDANASYRVETLAPYALEADNGFTASGQPNYNPWTPTVGSHSVTATPYTQGGAGGTAGTPLTINFTVTNTASTVPLRTPENPSNTVPGLYASYYEGTGWNKVPSFDALAPVASGAVSTVNLSLHQREDNFAFRYTGYVTVPADGMYTFYTTSDDGSVLYIGSTLVVNNDGQHGTQEASGQIALQAGTHALTIGFFESGGDQVLTASYAGPGLAKTVLPAAALSYVATARTNARTSTAKGNLETAQADAETAQLAEETVQLYPNPATNQVQVSVLAATAGEVHIEIRDALARRVLGATHQAKAGWNQVSLSLGQLPAGIYSVSIQQGAKRTVRRLAVGQ